MSIRFKTSFLECEFKHHVNIVGGLNDIGTNSGREKTHLFSLLETVNETMPVVPGYSTVFISNVQAIANMVFTENNVVIVDEANCKPGLIKSLYNKVAQVNAYLVLIGRITSSVIPCNFEALYYITNFTEGKVTISRLANLFSTFEKVESISGVYSEDGKQTANFLSIVTGLDVQSANGNSKFYNKMKMFPDDSVLLLADNHKYGSLFLSQIKRLKRPPKVVYLFLPACFEEIILDYFEEESVRNHLLCGTPIDVTNSETKCVDIVREMCFAYNKKQSLVSFWECVRNSAGCSNCFLEGESLLIEELKKCNFKVNGVINKESGVWFKVDVKKILTFLTDCAEHGELVLETNREITKKSLVF